MTGLAESSDGTDPVSSEGSGGASGGDEGGLARQLAQAVLAVPGVVDLDGGLHGQVATYLPGERINGIALTDEGGTVHIVVDLRHDLRAVAAQVAEIAAELCGLPVDVTVADVIAPSETESTGGGRNV